MTDPLFWSESIWIIDSCSIIDFKDDQIIPRGQLPAVLDALEELVINGTMGFPMQVKEEVCGKGQKDEPAEWTNKMHEKYLSKEGMKKRYNSSDRYFQHVNDTVPDVLDERKKGNTEEADPHILAAALELRDNGYKAIVITEETVDRPPRKISMKTAGERLGITIISMQEFLEQQEILQKSN